MKGNVPLNITPTDDDADYELLDNGLKKCKRCRQVWMAKINYCPYCNITPANRIAYVQRMRKEGKE